MVFAEGRRLTPGEADSKFAHMTADFFRSQIEDSKSGDHQRMSGWPKGWITSGGAAHIEPWLASVASGLMAEQPKRAAHAIDLALKHWISMPRDRAALLWIRGRVTWERLNDPKSALLDWESASGDVPSWVEEHPSKVLDECRSAAASSRKRTPSVKPAPDYTGVPKRVLTAPTPLRSGLMAQSLPNWRWDGSGERGSLYPAEGVHERSHLAHRASLGACPPRARSGPSSTTLRNSRPPDGAIHQSQHPHLPAGERGP